MENKIPDTVLERYRDDMTVLMLQLQHVLADRPLPVVLGALVHLVASTIHENKLPMNGVHDMIATRHRKIEEAAQPVYKAPKG